MRLRNDMYNTPPGMQPGEVWNNVLSGLGHLNRTDCEKRTVVVVGSGLSGLASAFALRHAGFKVKLVYSSDIAFRAHSGAAQGGINSAIGIDPNDTVLRFVDDIISGGDFGVPLPWAHRFAGLSTHVIDQLAAMGVPLSVGPDGGLEVRSFGGVHGIERVTYVRGETGKHIMRALYQSVLALLEREDLVPYSYVLDPIIDQGVARGVVVLNTRTGKVEPILADAVVVATGGYASMYYGSTNAADSGGGFLERLLQHGAYMANPSLVQIHPTAMYMETAKRILMTEALRNHARLWVWKEDEHGNREKWFFMEELDPAAGNLNKRDITTREILKVIDMGLGVGPNKRAVYLDMTDAVNEYGREYIEHLYGNVLQMYKDFSGTDPYTEPMMVTPAAHFTMGGIEVNYLLESHIPGCFVVGEAAHSIHAFNRLGANALQQTVQDGMFILPAGVHDYFSRTPAMTNLRDLESQALRLAQWWQEELEKRAKQEGQYESVMELQQELGRIMYLYAGAVRSEDGLHKGLAELEMLKERLQYAVVGEELAWNTTLTDYLTLKGHVALAEYVFRDSLGWTQSRGALWRQDFPESDYTDNAIHVWKRVKGGRLQSESRQLQYPFTPQRSEH